MFRRGQSTLPNHKTGFQRAPARSRQVRKISIILIHSIIFKKQTDFAVQYFLVLSDRRTAIVFLTQEGVMGGGECSSFATSDKGSKKKCHA